MLEDYFESVNNFKDRYYLVNPFGKVSHASLSNIYFELPYQCSDNFSKFWLQSHFLADVECYVYKLNDFSQEETYMKRNLVAFFKNLGLMDIVAPSGAASKKQKNWFIERHLLVKDATKKDRQVIIDE